MAERFKVLLVGSGGREFAFLRKLLQSQDVFVHVAPGLSGMLYPLNEEERSRVKLYPDIKAANVKAIVDLAMLIKPDLVIVGPEDPLILGLADELVKMGFKVFGFNKSAARLEGSKWFCKEAYKSCGLPTAPAILITHPDQIDETISQLRKQGQPVVLKCNGPALGKGVIIVPLDQSNYWGETERQLRMMLHASGPLGFVAQAVLLENRYAILNEFSAMHLVGPNFIDIPLMPTKDHKRALDNDQGLNTGGMGIVTPAPGFNLADMEKRRGPVNFLRTLMRVSHQTELCGILYEGLNRMLGEDYLVEINVRGGDPETQGQLEFITGVPFHELLLAIVEGNREIASRVIVPQDLVLVGVVMASAGYPGPYEKGKRIIIPEQLPAPGEIFPAGLVWENGNLLTAGGRVLMAVGCGQSVAVARTHAYQIVKSISHEGALVWRNDIGIA